LNTPNQRGKTSGAGEKVFNNVDKKKKRGGESKQRPVQSEARKRGEKRGDDRVQLKVGKKKMN